MNRPPCPGNRFGGKYVFGGSWPDPEGQGVLIISPKITGAELGWPWKFGSDLSIRPKVISLCRGDRRTDSQTDTQTNTRFESSCTPLVHPYAWGDRKLQTLQKFYHFTLRRINQTKVTWKYLPFSGFLEWSFILLCLLETYKMQLSGHFNDLHCYLGWVNPEICVIRLGLL